MNAPLGLEEAEFQTASTIWQSASFMVNWICEKENVEGLRVLELGAGAGSVGICCVRRGAQHVILSDLSRVVAQGVIEQNCISNGLNTNQFRVMALKWGDLCKDLTLLKDIDLVVASDIFYNSADVEDILATVSWLLEKSGAKRFLTCYEVRSDTTIIPQLSRWNIAAKSIGGNERFELIEMTATTHH